MKLKNKILIILIILAGFIFLNSTNCFATWTGSFEDVTLNIEFNPPNGSFDDYSYKMFIKPTISSHGYLIYSDGPFTLRDKTSEDVNYHCLSSNNGSLDSGIIIEVSDTSSIIRWDAINFDNGVTINEESNTYTITKSSNSSGHDCSIIRKDYNSCFAFAFHNSDGQLISDYTGFSTNDIDCLATNAVFPNPPQEQGTTLAPIVEEVETEKTLAQVVAILPIVLIVIVGLIAIRKALQLLAMILTKA